MKFFFILASPTGSMRKTAKSKCLEVLESSPKCNPETITSEVALIDGMALIQTLRNPANTFGKLSNQIYKSVLTVAQKFQCKRVDFVGDCYPTISIKGAEREKRAVDGCQVFSVVNANQKVPADWKKFLSVGKNKENLLSFLSVQWRSMKPADFADNLKLFIAESQNCFAIHKVKKDDVLIVQPVESLCCDHEEADTRLILHAQHAAQEGYVSAVVRTPDTDVIITLVGLEEQISSELYVETGNGNRQRLIDINQVATSMPLGSCQSIIGFHALTGK